MPKVKFITGPAGTGKSHLLRQLLAEETLPHLVCAPTGIAATNIGGSTIHRTFKINIDSGFVGKKWPEIRKVYIDEASMMGMRLFESVMAGAPNAEIVLVGDMAQLPPVKDKFWFQTESHIDLSIQNLIKQYRQSEDPNFANILNLIRKGKVIKEQLDSLYRQSVHPDDNENAITLAFRNDTVRAINAEKLLGLKTKLFESPAIYSGLMRPQDCAADEILSLKEGAEVIMINNDRELRWNNGTRALIWRIFENSVTILINDATYIVDLHTWQMKLPVAITPLRRAELQDLLVGGLFYEEHELIQSYLNTGIEFVIVGTCKQYPMKLAYALTVHKSQGMTLDNVHIITSGFDGCHGIGYVALSRAKTLDTVSFDKRPHVRDFKFDSRLEYYI